MPANDPSDAASRIDDIVADYADRLNAGERLRPENILAEFPNDAGEILDRLETFVDLASDPAEVRPLGTLGDYTLRRQIGRGGMGVVYEAWENSMDRAVALKVLPGAVAADDRAFSRFLREARTAGKLSHPNVVPVFGVGIKEHTPYFAMEYVEGETFAKLLARIKNADPETETPFGPKDSAAYFDKLGRAFADVADGLQHAHSKGVTHRDIKPSNLILDREGRLRILDFGLARLEGQESLTLSGDFVGTPLYMSPEQARRKKIPVDHRTDVYSLGATMYEAICGRPPFRGKDHADTLSQIIERDPRPPRQLNPRAPVDLETIVLKCLRKDSGDRYGTAEALGQDLRRFVRGDAVEARPEGRWERFAKSAWRHRRRFIGLTSLVLMVVLGGSLSRVLWTRHERWTLDRYESYLEDALSELELGVLTAPGELGAGSTISLGIVYPEDVGIHAFYRQSRIQKAVESLRDAVSLRPQRAEAYVHLSRAQWALADFDAAEDALGDALSADPGFVPALLLELHRSRQRQEEAVVDDISPQLESATDEPWERVWLEAHRAAEREDWETVYGLYGALLYGTSRPPFAGFDVEMRLKRGRVALVQKRYNRAIGDFYFVRESSRQALGPVLLLASTYYEIGAVDDAVSILDESLRVSPLEDGAGIILGVADLHSAFKNFDEARAAVGRIADEAVRRAAMARVLLAEGKAAEAIEAGQAALRAGFDEAWVYSVLSEALYRAWRTSEAIDVIRVAESKYPSDRGIATQLWRLLYIQGEYDELIERCRDRNEAVAYQILGFCLIRKGVPEDAIAPLSEAVRLYPRLAAAYQARAWAYRVLGDIERSVADGVRLVALKPEHGRADELRYNYSADTRHFFKPHWKTLDRACERAVTKGVLPQRFLGLRALACLYKKDSQPDRALELAREGVEVAEKGWRLGEALGYLGEVLGERGELVAAVRVLERGARDPTFYHSSHADLERYRKALLPTLASCQSVDAHLGGALRHIGEDHKDPYRQLRVDASEQSGRTVAGYLEALRFEREGHLERAVSILTIALATADALDRTSVVLSLARVLERLGRIDEALVVVEDECLQRGNPSLEVWAAWLRLAEPTLRGDTHPLLERLESLGDLAPSSISDDVAWLLERLDREGVVRLNCGGREYVDSTGAVWGRDRFFDGGDSYTTTRVEISTDDDEELYHSRRIFEEREYARPSYSIPVPPGNYDITIHFCVASHLPTQEIFGIAIGGQRIREPFEPLAVHEFGVPFEVHEGDVAVKDGMLRITFTDIHYIARVNALELRRRP